MIRKKRKKQIDMPKAAWGALVSAIGKASNTVYDQSQKNLNRDQYGNVIQDQEALDTARRNAFLTPLSTAKATISNDAYTTGQKVGFGALDFLGLGNFTAKAKQGILEEDRLERNADLEYQQDKQEAAVRLGAQRVREDRNTPIFRDGGQMQLNGQGDFKEDSIDEIKGDTHEEGGTNISNIVEAEKGETLYDGYIFSDDLKLTEEKAEEYNLPNSYVGKSLAEVSKKLKNKYSLRENDVFDEPARKAELEALKEMQESIKLEKFEKQLSKLKKNNPEFLQQLGNAINPQQQTQQIPQEQQMQQEQVQQPVNEEGLPQMFSGGDIYPEDPPEDPPKGDVAQYTTNFLYNGKNFSVEDARFMNSLLNNNYWVKNAQENSPEDPPEVYDNYADEPVENTSLKLFPYTLQEGYEKYTNLEDPKDPLWDEVEGNTTQDNISSDNGDNNKKDSSEIIGSVFGSLMSGNKDNTNDRRNRDDGSDLPEGYNSRKFRVGDNLGNIYSLYRGIKGLNADDQVLERTTPGRITGSYMDPSRAISDMTSRGAVGGANAVSSVGGAGAQNAMGLISRTALARSIGRVNQQYDQTNVQMENAVRNANARLAESAKQINLQQSNLEQDINDRNKAVSSNEIQQALANASTISQMRERENNQMRYQMAFLRNLDTQNIEFREQGPKGRGYYYKGTDELYKSLGV